MTNFKKLALGSLFTCAAVTAFSADANLNFTGTIYLPSCTVDSSTANQTIPLGTAKTTDFLAVNSTANPYAFNIKLISCSPGTVVTMTVSGNPVASYPSVLQSTGSASQVGVQLLKAASAGATTGVPLSLNTAAAQGTVDATNTMTIPLVAQFYRLGTMTAGSVVASATVNFVYN